MLKFYTQYQILSFLTLFDRPVLKNANMNSSREELAGYLLGQAPPRQVRRFFLFSRPSSPAGIPPGASWSSDSVTSDNTSHVDSRIGPRVVEDTRSVVLPHHKLKNVTHQEELIDTMKNMKDGEFVYLTYAVPRSSEHYTPYALT